MTFAAIEALGLERWLAGLREELVCRAGSRHREKAKRNFNVTYPERLLKFPRSRACDSPKTNLYDFSERRHATVREWARCKREALAEISALNFE
jgi:hypothetical protein